MRIRKGPRCVPLSPAADRSFLLKTFHPGAENNARHADAEKTCYNNGGVGVVEVPGGGGGGGAASVAATSGCQDRVLLVWGLL